MCYRVLDVPPLLRLFLELVVHRGEISDRRRLTCAMLGELVAFHPAVARYPS